MIPPFLAAKLASPLIRYAAVGIVAAVAAVTVTRWYYSGKIARMELAWETARADAITAALAEQKRVDVATIDAAVKAAAAEIRIVKETSVITKWAIKNVEVVANCPDDTLVCLHNAAAIGADPAAYCEGTRNADGATSPARAATPGR